MRVVIALTYYRPHVSGLTIYAERLARGLAANGHKVTILTSQFAPGLRQRERAFDVDIIRVPVARKVSKGVIMPTFPVHAWRCIAQADVLNVHMPQLEAALAACARTRGVPVVLTYQCDLHLPEGALNRFVGTCLKPLNLVAARLADAVVVSSRDYADHSAFLKRQASKVVAIRPLIEPRHERPDLTQALTKRWNLGSEVRIGFAARFAAEKGVEYLLQALPRLIDAFPDVRVLFSGAYRDTVGEEAYWNKLTPMIDRYRERLIFLDLLPDEAMPSFFSLCNAVAVTSLNSTEAYGLVQPEAMLAGTPVVATDLPGVREPVALTGMGRIVRPRDPGALADALIEVVRNADSYVQPAAEIAALFEPQASLAEYESLFSRLTADDPA